MKTAKILFISGKSLWTKFMQCADVFDNGKVIGTIKEMTIEYKEKEEIDFVRVGSLFESIKIACENQKENVYFIHVLSIQDKNTIILNNHNLKPYYDSKVREISDGTKCFLFYDFLASMGFNVETTQDMYIKDLN